MTLLLNYVLIRRFNVIPDLIWISFTLVIPDLIWNPQVSATKSHRALTHPSATTPGPQIKFGVTLLLNYVLIRRFNVIPDLIWISFTLVIPDLIWNPQVSATKSHRALTHPSATTPGPQIKFGVTLLLNYVLIRRFNVIPDLIWISFTLVIPDLIWNPQVSASKSHRALTHPSATTPGPQIKFGVTLLLSLG